ncbi:helix-turn-helix domain-containing protein [Tsukamurella soli]|uniref:Helix-turn-helix domain-containing protein n=1 Tax=Tsukamurella soli TaxID=644556 RepID=A0ABP8KBJ7_9ACTN
MADRRVGYRAREVAAMSGVGLRTVQRKIADGTLVAHRCGAAVLVYPEDLREWLDGLPRVGGGDAA